MNNESAHHDSPQASEPLVSINLAVADDKRVTETRKPDAAAKVTEARAAGSSREDAPPSDALLEKRARQNHLPALDDDSDVGVEKEHIITRDGKADLMFMGVLLASAAPTSAPKGEWQEYRIYLTTAGRHVFSKVTRHAREDAEDAYEAEVFDPDPPSTSSKLMRSAREMVRSEPLTWKDAAVHFFGYDPLAKALYRKLDVRFEEQIA